MTRVTGVIIQFLNLNITQANAHFMPVNRKYELKAGFIRFNFHGPEQSVLESAIARGDRRMCDVIETAFKSGARFDLWTECFDHHLWEQAFEKHGMDLDKAAQKNFETTDTLPWQHLGGPAPNRILHHFNDAMDIIEKY